MLTVKVTRRVPSADGNVEEVGRFSTRIVEADEVDIHILRPGELYEVAGSHQGKYFAFYIADQNKPRPEGFALDVDFWFSAYVENAAGATTEVVRF